MIITDPATVLVAHVLTPLHDDFTDHNVYLVAYDLDGSIAIATSLVQPSIFRDGSNTGEPINLSVELSKGSLVRLAIESMGRRQWTKLHSILLVEQVVFNPFATVH